MGKSNLGDYQIITTLSKKVGGPRNLCLIILAAGGIIAEGLRISCRKIKQTVVKKSQNGSESEEKVYTVYSDIESAGNLKFMVGDKFKVLSSDGDVILIEKVGDPDNPYFVSAEFLSSISNFKV